MRLSVWIVRQFIRFWPLRGGHPANDPNTRYIDSSRLRRKPLYIPTDEELMQRAYVRALARDLAGVRVSRRKFLDWVTDEIYAADGRYLDINGKPVSIGEPAEPFPLDEGKWNADFLKWADREPRQGIQRKILPRLRVLAMAREAYRDRIGR